MLCRDLLVLLIHGILFTQQHLRDGRCSPESSPDGAMCLILPREKLEDAVRRDRTASSAPVFSEKDPLGPGDLEARAQKAGFPLDMVNFGGPEPPEEPRHHTMGNADKRKEQRTALSTHPATAPVTRNQEVSPAVLADAERNGRQEAFMTDVPSSVASGLDEDVLEVSSSIPVVTGAFAIDDPEGAEGENIVDDAGAGYGMYAGIPGAALSESFSTLGDGKRRQGIAQNECKDLSTVHTIADLGTGLEASHSAARRHHSCFPSSIEGSRNGGEGVETESQRVSGWTGAGANGNLLDAIRSFVLTHVDSWKVIDSLPK